MYPFDLTQLGFKMNDEGQFVKIEAPDQFFDFFHTDNDRANEVRKEAIHTCARMIVKRELAQLGVAELYLSSTMGEVSTDKPMDRHTKIFATELDVSHCTSVTPLDVSLMCDVRNTC